MKKFIVSLFTLTLFAANMMAQCDVPGTVTATVRLVRKPSTLLHGQFSVAADRKVSFSKGNLQYMASTGTWRFAEHQYDIEGNDNASISSSYADYIDLFGYGTSGHNSKTPYMTSTTASEYISSDLVGETNKLYDWGRKNYTTDVDTAYRVLTAAEWKYLLTQRTNASSLRAQATVAGVRGWVILPDDWVKPGDVTFSTTSLTNYGSNIISADDWVKMENAGAVFLPAAGQRSGTTVSGLSESATTGTGNYWSSTAGKGITFTYNTVNADATIDRSTGLSVRLVQTL